MTRLADLRSARTATYDVVHIGMEAAATRPGGLNRYVDNLVRAQCNGQMLAVAVLHSGDNGARSPSLVVGTGSLPRRLWNYFLAGRHVRSRVVDSHFALYGLAYMLGQKSIGQRPRLVTHFHGPWAMESQAASSRLWRADLWLRMLVETMIYRRSALVITISNHFADLVAERYGVARGAVRRVPPGVAAPTRVLPNDEARGLLGWPVNVPIVLCVRRLTMRMGIDMLLHAAVDVPSAHFAVVGDGPARGALEGLRDHLRLGGRVEFLGRVDDDLLDAAYSAADLTVVPTRSLEGFGLVVLESLARGTPVVATRVGGLEEALGALSDDLLVEPEPRALARRIDEALSGRVPTRAACEAYASRFDWNAVARAHARLYDESQSQ